MRFRDGRLVHDFIFRSLHKALAQVRPEIPTGGGIEQLGVMQGQSQMQPQGLEMGVFAGQTQVDLGQIAGNPTSSTMQQMPWQSGSLNQHSPHQMREQAKVYASLHGAGIEQVLVYKCWKLRRHGTHITCSHGMPRPWQCPRHENTENTCVL